MENVSQNENLGQQVPSITDPRSIMRRIYNMRNEGESFAAIAKKLKLNAGNVKNLFNMAANFKNLYGPDFYK